MESKEIFELVLKYKNEITEHRRYFHQNPELSYKEFNTSEYIKSKLKEEGISYKDGYGITGVLAEIKGGKPSDKVLLIRADMDALPICENTDKPYKSKNSGIMHACGHDAHTAILLGLCSVINELKNNLSGTVKFVFQPAEELDGGAMSFIDGGALKNPDVDACLALHVDPDIDSGKIRVKSGSLYASPDDFYIKIIGKGGHGAERFNCIDPIEISAKVVSELLKITENELPDENAVITVGTINAGTATNIIPDFADISGTARSLSNNVRSFLKARIEEVLKSVCDMYGASYEYKFDELAPPLVNDSDLAEDIIKSAREILGDENVITGGSHTMAGEDFSYFAQLKPSVMIKLGCRNEEMEISAPIHNPMFDIDENCLLTGVLVFANFVKDFLN